MKGYTFEFKVEGEIVKIDADTIAEALTQAPAGALLLGSIDRKPQTFLAW